MDLSCYYVDYQNQVASYFEFRVLWINLKFTAVVSLIYDRREIWLAYWPVIIFY
jgi:hypothetical protein